MGIHNDLNLPDSSHNRIGWADFFICFLFGWLGMHKFYQKNRELGLLYLFTLGLFGVGWVIDTVKYFRSIVKYSQMSDFYKSTFKKTAIIASAIITVFMLFVCVSAKDEPDLVIFILICNFIILVPLNLILYGIMRIIEKVSPKSKITHKNSQSVQTTLVTSVPNTITPITPTCSKANLKKESLSCEEIIWPEWYISVSFGKSSSSNYEKAVALVKSAPQYHEQIDNGNILHQGIYSAKPNEYLDFITLYELVSGWKSSFVMINGKIIDRKIVGSLNYCYGDRCRSGNPDFCYGASYMTENPFGCHRLQISAANHPWWSYYTQVGHKWVLDKAAMKQRIDSYAEIYSLCPKFNYNNILAVLNVLPNSLSNFEMERLRGY